MHYKTATAIRKLASGIAQNYLMKLAGPVEALKNFGTRIAANRAEFDRQVQTGDNKAAKFVEGLKGRWQNAKKQVQQADADAKREIEARKAAFESRKRDADAKGKKMGENIKTELGNIFRTITRPIPGAK